MTDILQKIEPINRLLESRFGVRVEVSSFEHLIDIRDHYDAKRRLFLETMGESQAIQSAEYAKAVLISEAVRLLLREIAPKRMRKRK
jgi:predicted transcriptional regulator